VRLGGEKKTKEKSLKSATIQNGQIAIEWPLAKQPVWLGRRYNNKINNWKNIIERRRISKCKSVPS